MSTPVEARGGVARTRVRPDDDVPAVLTRLYASAVRDRGTVHVVQLTAPWACDLGIELVVSASIAGDVVTHHDATPGAPPPEPDALSGRATPTGVVPRGEIRSVRWPRLDGTAVAVLRDAAVAVLVIDADTPTAVLGDAVEMLEGLGVALRGVVDWRGRIPRDPSWALSSSRRTARSERAARRPRPGSRSARASASVIEPASRARRRW